MNGCILGPLLDGEPIIHSLLDVDFYKFTMGQFIFTHFKDVRVCFTFKNRSKNFPLGKYIFEDELRSELDHARGLRFTRSELHYLRGTDEYSERMFTEDYLNYLRNYSLPPYELSFSDGDISLTFEGSWKDVTYWETIALSIISELFYLNYLRNLSRIKRDAILAMGIERLSLKIQLLKDNPSIVFSDFGTRRRFSRNWHDYVVRILSEELSDSQFRGTSSTYFAMKYGLMPMGTNAHELQMVIAGLMSEDDQSLRASQNHMLSLWWLEYGEPLSIFLPDTFGTKSFLKTLDPQMARNWRGFRQDSGDPSDEGNTWIEYYESHGIDARGKSMIASDGLELKKMIELEAEFRNRIKISFGWGTNLTNDLGLANLSLVVKATEANGAYLVKLSNNPAKAIGPKSDIERYKRVFGYDDCVATECKY